MVRFFLPTLWRQRDGLSTKYCRNIPKIFSFFLLFFLFFFPALSALTGAPCQGRLRVSPCRENAMSSKKISVAGSAAVLPICRANGYELLFLKLLNTAPHCAFAESKVACDGLDTGPCFTVSPASLPKIQIDRLCFLRQHICVPDSVSAIDFLQGSHPLSLRAAS